MSERQEGWYWVKVGGSWMVMECMGGLWIGPGDVMPHGEFDWMEIGPRIPTPDETEGWQLVPVEPTREMLCVMEGDDLSHSAVVYEAMLAAAPKTGS